LQQRGIDVKGFWFNPNIHPYIEYKNRLDALRKLEGLWGLDVEYDDSYGLTEFLRNVVFHEKDRCAYCYAIRLERTVSMAWESKADAFTTSLLVSPYQNIDMIKSIGFDLQEKWGVEFHFEDFRGGYGEGRRIAKEMNLYSQKYCGCIYSEMERYKEICRGEGPPHIKGGPGNLAPTGKRGTIG
jgi:predicted adenine nucleotide alpha hydrolase (AANH) superfamily ATPase